MLHSVEAQTLPGWALPQSGIEDLCSHYFGLGIEVKLQRDGKVFQPSKAGLAFGEYLLSNVTIEEKIGDILEIGTGSGALAILLAVAGARNVVATDINQHIVDVARANYGIARRDFRSLQGERSPNLRFLVSNLFDSPELESRRFDLIFFNPPGWRTPDDPELFRTICEDSYYSMFEGDQTVTRFLQQVGRYLKPNGRVLIGLNSIVGIQSVIAAYREWEAKNALWEFDFTVRQKNAIELMLYNDHWKQNGDLIRNQLLLWKQRGLSHFSHANDHSEWFYEITEIQNIT